MYNPSTHLLLLFGQRWSVLDALCLVAFFRTFDFKWWLRNPHKQATSLNHTINIFSRVHVVGQRKPCVSLSSPFSALSTF